jgi:hypothetical protein
VSGECAGFETAAIVVLEVLHTPRGVAEGINISVVAAAGSKATFVDSGISSLLQEGGTGAIPICTPRFRRHFDRNEIHNRNLDVLA